MKKIGAIILNWNGEKFIVPHLRMLTQGGVDEFVMIQGTAPWSDYEKEYHLSSKPDNSEALVKDLFPQVKIIPAVENKFSSVLYNQGLEALQDCDLVLRLDYDMFLTKEDWKTFMDILHDDNFQYENVRLDFSRNTINYYGDFYHGVRNAKEFDPIAVSPATKFSGLLDYPDDDMTILSEVNGHFFTIHHFRGWKGFGVDPLWLDNMKPNHHGVFADELLEFNPDKQWIAAPLEIQEMFEGKC